MKSIFKLFILVSFIQSFPYFSFGQVSVSVRYGKGFVNQEILPSYGAYYGSFRENSIARNDLAFGLNVPIVKKWKLYVQAELEIQKKGFQKQFLTVSQIPQPDGTIKLERVYEDIFLHIQYTSSQFPILIRKEFEVIPKLNVNILAGILLDYKLNGVNSNKLYYNGQESELTYIKTANSFQFFTEEARKSFSLELESFAKNDAKTPLIAGAGVSYQLSNFRLGAEYRYTTNNLLARYKQPYHSVNFTLAYNLFNKNENKN